jgi:uncharacterized membrane protein
MEDAAFRQSLLVLIEYAALAVELLAIGIILVAITTGTYRYAREQLGRSARQTSAYATYREGLAKALLIGLEVLVAADIIRTVALEPTLQSVGLLGLLVLIRTFLSWSLVVELEGRWPWQGGKSGKTIGEG